MYISTLFDYQVSRVYYLGRVHLFDSICISTQQSKFQFQISKLCPIFVGNMLKIKKTFGKFILIKLILYPRVRDSAFQMSLLYKSIPGGNLLLFSQSLMMSKNSDLFGYDLVKRHKQSRDSLEVNTIVRWFMEFLYIFFKCGGFIYTSDS